MLPVLPPEAPALPASAAIPGLVFRHTSGPADTDALLAVHTGRAARDRLDPFSTEGELPRRDDVLKMLAKTGELGQADRVLVAEVEGQVIGYSRLSSWREGDGMCVLLTTGWVLPQWRGKGVGTAMLRRGEERARRLAAAEYPGEEFEFAANASSTEPEATALLLHEGYSVAYTVLEMEWESGPLPPPQMPPGLHVRPALPGHCMQISASVYDAYSGEYPDRRFKEVQDIEGFAAELAGSRHDPTLWQVAWDGDEIAGQVLSRMGENRAEVFEVSVRPRWRRRGLARALLTRSLECLLERRVDTIRLGTVAEFPTRAWSLYESVGFKTVKTFPRYRKPG